MDRSNSTSAGRRWEESYFLLVIYSLSVTATFKLISAFGTITALSLPNPLFGIREKDVLLITALVELFVAAFLYFSAHSARRFLMLLWLGGCFLIYRLLILVIAPGHRCGCLGTINEWLNVDTKWIERIPLFILACFLTGPIVYFAQCKFGRHAGPSPCPIPAKQHTQPEREGA